MAITEAQSERQASGPDSAVAEGALECLFVYLTAQQRAGEPPDPEQDEGYALPMHRVREIIRVPKLNRVPMGGEKLLGVTNLRGQVLPVVSLRSLVGVPAEGAEAEQEHSTHGRIVVLRGDYPLGLRVDWVEKVDQVPESRLDTSDMVRRKASHDLLAGFVRPDNAGTGAVEADESRLRRLLDVEALHRASLAPPVEEKGDSLSGHGGSGQGRRSETEAEDTQQYVCFELGAQIYSLSVSQIKEVVRVPENPEAVSGMPDHVLGVMPLRDLMVPLIRMSHLYGLNAGGLDQSARVIVVPVGARDGGAFLGLVVDGISTVVNLPDHQVQPVPESLASQPGFADIQGMLRLESGQDRLAALLDVRRLLAQEAFRAAARAMEDTAMTTQDRDEAVDERQIVVFSLGAEEYGVAIEAAKEILRVPETLTRVPQAPWFIEGVLNLRGMVLPVIDLRKRFGLDGLERNNRQRIVVLNLNGQRTGFIVDAVREVLRIPKDAVQPAPPLSPEQSSLITEMANLTEAERLILLLDASRLVSDQETRQLQVAAQQSKQDYEPENRTTDD